MAGPTITLKQRACPACAAPIPPIPPAALSVACRYCGQSFEVVGAQPQRPAPEHRRRRSAAAEPVQAAPARPAPPKKESWFSLFIGWGCAAGTVGAFVLLLISLAVPAGVAALAAFDPELGERVGRAIGVFEAAPPPPAPTAGLGWRTGSMFSEAAPALVDVDGDGRLDLVGPFTSHDGAEPASWVGAFRGDDLREIWRLGPIPGGGPIAALAVGDRLVVLEPFGVVSLVDVATGARSGQLQLPSTPGRARLCRLEPGGSQVNVGGEFTLDARTGVGRPHRIADFDLPRTCLARREPGGTSPIAPRSAALLELSTGARRGPRLSIDGYKVQLALVDGDDGIAQVRADRGRPETVLIGFSPADLSERWRLPVRSLLEGGPTDDEPALMVDLGLGTALVVHNGAAPPADRMTGRAPAFVVALDARTGEPRWRQELGLGGAPGYLATFGDGRAWLAEPADRRARVFRLDVATGDRLVFGGAP